MNDCNYETHLNEYVSKLLSLKQITKLINFLIKIINLVTEEIF